MARDYTQIKLDRKPSPPDERDYRLAEYLQPVSATEPADEAYADKTLRQIAAEEGLSWPLWLRLWALVKTLFHGDPPPDSSLHTEKIWPDAHQLDQTDTGHCVGFGTAQWGNTLPIDDQYRDEDGHRLYYEAKRIELGQPDYPDPVPAGSGPYEWEDGAYVRDGMKVLRRHQRLHTYARARSVTGEVVPWIVKHGPVVVGTQWLAGMDAPAPGGLMSATGESRGGHCYCLDGFLPAGSPTPEGGTTFDEPVVRMQNSWGSEWNVRGYGYLTVRDLQKLLDDDGEAWAAVELNLASPPGSRGGYL